MSKRMFRTELVCVPLCKDVQQVSAFMLIISSVSQYNMLVTCQNRAEGESTGTQRERESNRNVLKGGGRECVKDAT